MPQQTPSSELNLKQLLTVLDAYRKGDFSARMSNDLTHQGASHAAL